MAVPDSGIEIFADWDRIVQVFSNLITNAINYTSEGGCVSVSVQDGDREVICSVKDTGVGISAENIPMLFNKFQQFGRQEGPGYRGTGLGLAIVKGLVEKHGGKIQAESEEGKGSVFTFTLEKYFGDKILIIAKDSEKQKFYKQLLEDSGHNVEVADTCDNASEKLKLHRMNFVIIDICGQCGADDFENVKRFIKGPEFKSVPAVVVLNGNRNNQKLEDFGIDKPVKFIMNPIDKDYLMEVLEKSLAGEEILK